MSFNSQARLKKCHTCNLELYTEHLFCTGCGSALDIVQSATKVPRKGEGQKPIPFIHTEIKVRTCFDCGTDNTLGLSFCVECGSPLPFAITKIVRTTIGYAGFWRRLAAYIIDGVILYAIALPFILATESAIVYVNGLGALIGMIYFIAFWMWKGQTPGKMVLGIRVVDANGGRIYLGRSILRYFGYFVSGIILFLGYFMIAWDGRKQGLHDKIAGTYVIITECL